MNPTIEKYLAITELFVYILFRISIKGGENEYGKSVTENTQKGRDLNIYY